MQKDKLALIFGGAVLACGAVYLYGNRIESKRYRLERLRVTLDDDPVNLRGASADDNGRLDSKLGALKKLSILHLSDLHLHAPDQRKAEFLSYVTSLDYDLVCLTGDIFENESGLKFAPSLLTKKPRLGAYAILGNHDYYAYTFFNRIFGRMIRRFRQPSQRRDVGPFISALSDCGYTVLRNESVRLPEEKISLIGVDYPGIDETALQELIAKAEKEDLLISLFHLPKNLEQFVRANIRLVLGGHTHGGQVRIPGIGALVTDSEMARHEASGLVRRDKTLFHISRGLGQDPFPITNFRIFCPPAATVLEITYQTSAPIESAFSDSTN